MTVMYSGAVDLLGTSRTMLDRLLDQRQQCDGEFLVGVVNPSDQDQFEIMVINLTTMRSRVYGLHDGWEQSLARDLGAGFFAHADPSPA